MSLTALELVQQACYEAKIPAPSALVGETDTSTLQLLHLFYETGRELRRARKWSQLKKSYTVFLEAGREQYDLPQDFYSALPDTHWDRTNSWRLYGPISDANYSLRKWGYYGVENWKSFRVFGPDDNPNSGQGQFWVDPIPGAGDVGTALPFEYISKSWLRPPNWTASEASVAQNTWRFSAGNNYKKSDASAENGSTIPPNMAYGVGQEGSVFWLAVDAPSAWSSSTLYAPGDYVTNDGGKWYLCTVGGTSAGSGGPTGTDSSITDNTVTWKYISVTAWAGLTDYIVDDHVSATGPLYYKCVKAGTSGKSEPQWTTTTVPDGDITWEFQKAGYESLVTDSDLCLFDDEVMIAGLKWRFMHARGLTFQTELSIYETLKRAAVSRWNTGQKISLVGAEDTFYPNVYEGGFG